MNPPLSNGFFSRRWRAEVDLQVLFWRDMLVIGSLINIIASTASLVLASQGVSMAIAAALHFAPLPYNGFLLAAVMRSPQRTALFMQIASIWFVLMTIA